MRISFLIAAAVVCLIAAAAAAQTANPKGDTPAVNAQNSPPNLGAPVAGANSFTEGQAKSALNRAASRTSPSFGKTIKAYGEERQRRTDAPSP